MFSIGRRAWVACAVALVSPSLLGAVHLNANFDARILAAHNRERAALGIPPLRWDPELAAAAAGWARHLSATGRFEHSPDDEDTVPQGENLWEGSRGYYSAERMVDAWAREKKYFKRGTFPNNSVTGKVEDVGHYTQLMWRDTNRVGCAMVRGSGDDVLVCRYSNAGNYDGEKPF